MKNNVKHVSTNYKFRSNVINKKIIKIIIIKCQLFIISVEETKTVSFFESLACLSISYG